MSKYSTLNRPAKALSHKMPCLGFVISIWDFFHRRVYRGLIKLTPKPGTKCDDAVSTLAREIAVGDTDQEVKAKRCYILSKVENGMEACNILHHDKLATTLWCSNKKLNHVQMKAVQLALTKRFQLIQGPPGMEYIWTSIIMLSNLGVDLVTCRLLR